MIKQMLSGPGHTFAALTATGAGIASGSAAVAGATYLGIRALQAGFQAPSDKEIAEQNGKNRNISPKQFK